MTVTDKLLAILSQLPSAITWNATSETVYRVAVNGLQDEDIKLGAQRILTHCKFRPTPSEVLLNVAIEKYGDAQPHMVTYDIVEGIRCGTPPEKLHPTVLLVLRKTGGYKAWRVEAPVKGQQLQEIINEIHIHRLTDYINDNKSAS
jgi:hypothetical protein